MKLPLREFTPEVAVTFRNVGTSANFESPSITVRVATDSSRLFAIGWRRVSRANNRERVPQGIDSLARSARQI